MPRFGSKPAKKEEMFRIPYFRQLSLKIFGKFMSQRFKGGSIDLNLRRSKLGISRVEFYSQTAMIFAISTVAAIVLDFVLALYRPHPASKPALMAATLFSQLVCLFRSLAGNILHLLVPHNGINDSIPLKIPCEVVINLENGIALDPRPSLAHKR